MRKKSTFEKITDTMLIGGLTIIAFGIGFKMGAKCQEKRGAKR